MYISFNKQIIIWSEEFWGIFVECVKEKEVEKLIIFYVTYISPSNISNIN